MALKNAPPIGFQEPNRKKSCYKEVCQGKYAYIFHFVEIEIRFWKSTSHNYKKAVYVCSLFPQNEITIVSNYLWIASEEEFCIYFDALYELFMLIANWKYVEFYIDHELCYPDELWIYMHQLIENTTVKTERFDIKAAIKDYNNPWKSEKKLYHIIRDLFVNEDVISHYHAHWLENLELDIYIVDYRIGIEYQGVQHYKPVKIWGGEDGFIRRRLNDTRKKNLCDANGVKLVYFTYLEELTYELAIEKLSPYM